MERAKQKGQHMQVDIMRILAASFCTRHISGSLNHTNNGASGPVGDRAIPIARLSFAVRDTVCANVAGYSRLVEDRTGLVEARATSLAQSGCTDLQASGLVEAKTFNRRPPTSGIDQYGHTSRQRHGRRVPRVRAAWNGGLCT